jgi:hypothetical protein
MSSVGKFSLVKCWELSEGFMSICEEEVCGRGLDIHGVEGDGRGGEGKKNRVFVAASSFF